MTLNPAHISRDYSSSLTMQFLNSKIWESFSTMFHNKSSEPLVRWNKTSLITTPKAKTISFPNKFLMTPSLLSIEHQIWSLSARETIILITFRHHLTKSTTTTATTHALSQPESVSQTPKLISVCQVTNPSKSLIVTCSLTPATNCKFLYYKPFNTVLANSNSTDGPI